MASAARVKDLVESMFDHDIRVDRAIHVQTMLAMPSWDLESAIEIGELDGLAAALGLNMTDEELAQAAKEEELGWVLRDVNGWAVQASAIHVGPWRESATGSRGRRAYPGMRTGQWFTAASYEGALAKAVKWVESDPPELLWTKGDDTDSGDVDG